MSPHCRYKKYLQKLNGIVIVLFIYIFFFYKNCVFMLSTKRNTQPLPPSSYFQKNITPEKSFSLCFKNCRSAYGGAVWEAVNNREQVSASDSAFLFFNLEMHQQRIKSKISLADNNEVKFTSPPTSYNKSFTRKTLLFSKFDLKEIRFL